MTLADTQDPILSTEITSDPSILRQREMEGLKRKIIDQRRNLEPLMVTPREDRLIDFRGSYSTNSRVRRLLYGPISTRRSRRVRTSVN